MSRLKRFATDSPLGFGVAITLASILMVIVSSVVANKWPAGSQGWFIAGTLGRVVSITILLAVVARLGWLRSAGLTRAGGWQLWLLCLPLLVYVIVASTYAMTGKLQFPFGNPALLSPAALFLMTHALFEEVVFRGLVMVALVTSWGKTGGVVKSVLVSSLIFAAMHLVGVLGGNPLPVVLLQCVGAFFLGILFCSLLLRGATLYPVVVLHGLINVAGYALLEANPSAAMTASGWLFQSILVIPPGLFGLVFLQRLQQLGGIGVVEVV